MRRPRAAGWDTLRAWGGGFGLEGAEPDEPAAAKVDRTKPKNMAEQSERVSGAGTTQSKPRLSEGEP